MKDKALALRMTDTELTDEGVMAEVQALPEPMRSRVSAFLDQSHMPAGVH